MLKKTKRKKKKNTKNHTSKQHDILRLSSK